MSVTKRINGDYTIINKDSTLGTSNVTVTTHTMFVDGNLVVGGNATSITKTDLNITDNYIMINVGETGAGVTAIYAGLGVDRGTLANVGIRWNETSKYWELTNNGSTYQAITSGNISAGIANVYADSSPTLSANLNLLNRTIYDSTVSNVAIDIATAGTGGTGVYSINAYGTNELILKRMALIYTNLL